MGKITLDMDFGNDMNQNEDIEIPKSDKSEDEKREYIKDLINEGLKMCENNAKNLSKTVEDVEKFLGFGVSEQMLDVFEYLTTMFEQIIPNLLRGDYDELIPGEILGDDEAEIDLLKDMFKSTRKSLLKAIEENKKNN